MELSIQLLAAAVARLEIVPVLDRVLARYHSQQHYLEDTLK